MYLHCVWLLVIVVTFPAQRHHGFPGDCLGHSALSSLQRDCDYTVTHNIINTDHDYIDYLHSAERDVTHLMKTLDNREE